MRAVTKEELQDVSSVPKEPTFLDYLRSGWQMNLSVAIDYTASNGEMDDEDCLHFMGQNNQYEAAINMVGGVVEPYDYDKLFPVYGFGGVDQFNGGTRVNHCFPLNGLSQNPTV